MGLVHVYRIMTHFQVIVGSHTIAQEASAGSRWSYRAALSSACSARRCATRYVELKVEDVAVLHDIFLAFLAQLAGVARAGLAVQGDIIVIGDGFGADEAALEIGVDLARRLRRLDPFSTVQARASLGPTVKKVIGGAGRSRRG